MRGVNSKSITALDIGRALGEDATAAIAHGKIHVCPVEDEDGVLYAATHIGFYRRRRGLAEPGRVVGRLPFGGGHFIAIDPRDGTVTSIARAPSEEGVIAMSMDVERRRLFGLTWPSGRLLQVDLARSGPPRAARLLDYGPVCGRAEVGPGPREPVCRTLAVDPRDGRVWWSRRSGECAFLDPDPGRSGTSGVRLGERRGGEPTRSHTTGAACEAVEARGLANPIGATMTNRGFVAPTITCCRTFRGRSGRVSSR